MVVHLCLSASLQSTGIKSIYVRITISSHFSLSLCLTQSNSDRTPPALSLSLSYQVDICSDLIRCDRTVFVPDLISKKSNSDRTLPALFLPLSYKVDTYSD